MFILVDDQYGVGDVVDLGVADGTVEAVTLRSTRIRSVDGTVWHVPNGQIQRAGNMSQHWSRALLDVQIALDSDIDRAREAMKRVADEVWREDRAIIEEPEVWGVQSLGPGASTIRLVATTMPLEQWRVSRLLCERIKAELDREGIEVPSPTPWIAGGQPVARGGSSEHRLAADRAVPPHSTFMLMHSSMRSVHPESGGAAFC